MDENKEPKKELEKETSQLMTEQQLDQVSGGKLYEALHNGTHIPKVIIELARPTEKSSN